MTPAVSLAPWTRRSWTPCRATYKWHRQSFLNQDATNVATVRLQSSATFSIIARRCSFRFRLTCTWYKFKVEVAGSHELAKSPGGMRPGPKPKINDVILSTLREAIITRRKVRLYYLYRGSGKRGYQIVHPYGLFYSNRHYLVAWSEIDRVRDFRNFALSNIERVEMVDSTFTRNRSFSLREYAQRSFGLFQEEPVDVVWKFSPKVAVDAREFVFHPTQVLEPQPDGSLTVRFRAGGLQEMAWHLVTWGDQVQIVKPKQLSAMLRQMSALIARAVQ